MGFKELSDFQFPVGMSNRSYATAQGIAILADDITFQFPVGMSNRSYSPARCQDILQRLSLLSIPRGNVE